MADRNDNELIEKVAVQVAIYLDDHDLSQLEGVKLTERLTDELLARADDRPWARD